MESIKIFGHKNPDMDSIAAAYSAAYLLKVRDSLEAKAMRLGEFNKETMYVINKFNLDLNMEVLESLEDKENVILVDHNEFTQSVNNIENAKINMVIDHHKIDNFKTNEPLEYIGKPIGSTSTIIYYMLKELNALDNNVVNTLLLSAILSDTLIFKSPTTTTMDKVAGTELGKMLNLNIEEYGLEILKAGADLSDLTAEELICVDSKVFDMNGKSIEINQINAVDLNNILDRQKEIEKAMNDRLNDKKLNVFLTVVTDIINCNSEIIALGDNIDIIEKAFNVKLNNNRAFLEGVVSRKKQVAPQIMEASK